jgi:hypothetical protein
VFLAQRRLRDLLLAFAVILILPVLSSCAGSEQPSVGRLAATVREVGGPPPGINRLVAGTIELTDRSGGKHNAYSVTGRISIDISVGRYRVVATSPLVNSNGSPCSGPTVLTIREGSTTHGSFNCDIP